MANQPLPPVEIETVLPVLVEPAPPAVLGPRAALRAFLEGIGFIIGTPSVWIYSAVPAAMMLVLLVVFSGLGIWGANRASGAIIGEVSSTWGHIGSWILTALLALLSLLLAVLLALVLAQPLSCFALEKIAHSQEHALTGRKTVGPPYLLSVFLTFKATLLALCLGVPVLVVLFVINLIFPPATVITLPLKFLVVSWMLAWDFLDYPLGLRRHGLRARFCWVGRNFGAFTVFGMLWAIFIIIPGIVLLLLPMGVAGATRLVVEDAKNVAACG